MGDTAAPLPTRLGVEPLVEAIWEMRFVPEHNAAAAVIFGRLLNDFGNGAQPEQLPISQVPAGFREQDANLRYVPSLRFRSGPFLYNCGERAIALSSPRPYVGWANFRKAIESVAKAVYTTGAVREPERMSLKYVDLINIGSTPSLSRLNLDVRVGEMRLDNEPFQMRTEIRRDGTIHLVQIGLPAVAIAPNSETQPGVLLDIDSIIEPVDKGASFWDTLGKTIDEAHTANKKVFFFFPNVRDACGAQAGVRNMTPDHLRQSHVERRSGLYGISFALAESTSSSYISALGTETLTRSNSERATSPGVETFVLDPTGSQAVTIGFAATVLPPRTALWRRLMAIREQAIREGLTLLTAEEISREVANRRGELE